ncbi:MAG: SxtJ family membrane protein [Acidobacteriota bacterium]
MSIREEIRLLPTDTRALRNFGLLVGGVFCLIGGLLLWREVTWALIPLWIGGPLMLLGAVVPRVLRPIYLGWMTMAIILGAFMTRVLLTLFFFLVLTPVGLFFRLIGRDALHRRLDRDAASYWIAKEYPIPGRERFEKFF